MNNWNNPLAPENVVMGFCVPTTPSGYIEHAQHPVNREFVQKVTGCKDTAHSLDQQYANRYNQNVTRWADFAADVVKSVGAQVIRDVTPPVMTQLLSNRDCKCLLLFAHHSSRRKLVEFYDGFRTHEEFIDAVPNSYENTLPMVLCHSRELAVKLAMARPATAPNKFEDEERDFQHAVLFESAVVKLLAEGDFSYYEAVEACSRGAADIQE